MMWKQLFQFFIGPVGFSADWSSEHMLGDVCMWFILWVGYFQFSIFTC